ncbi:hypothetical protein IJ098_01300 [Candidatus Saccharibacteria bacterium]|nr:hypothetical protein [Candidatus Saccharibacteria bacterium]
MNTKSNAPVPNDTAKDNGLSMLADLFDAVNRRLGKDAVVAIPTKEDERKERQNATASK